MRQQSNKLFDLSTPIYRIVGEPESDKNLGMAKKPPNLKKLVGERLRVIRKALQLGTKQAMADLLGVSHARYSAWEDGKNLLPVEFGSILEGRYNVSMSWLYSADSDRTDLELLRRA